MLLAEALLERLHQAIDELGEALETWDEEQAGERAEASEEGGKGAGEGRSADGTRQEEPRLDAQLLAELAELHPGEAAEVYESLDEEGRRVLLRAAGAVFNCQALAWLDDSLIHGAARGLGTGRVAKALTELDSDDALAVFEELDEDFRDELLLRLPPETRGRLRRGMAFGEDTAGRLMQSEVPVAPANWTVGETIDWMRSFRAQLRSDFYELIVVDPTYRPLGRVPISRILKNRRATPLTELAERRLHPIRADAHQEEVAKLFKRYALVSAPVVDESGRLLGTITADDVVEVIEEEMQRDLLQLVGVQDSGLFGGLQSSVRARLPWLSVNFITILLAAAVIDAFSATIERNVALAALLPVVAALGGNAGVQSLTVSVRGLATEILQRPQRWRFVRRELLINLVNGAALAVAGGVLCWLWFGQPRLGAVVAIAILANLLVAGLAGAAVPMALKRLGADPAVSSGVFVTTATDIAGFFILLSLASMAFL